MRTTKVLSDTAADLSYLQCMGQAVVCGPSRSGRCHLSDRCEATQSRTVKNPISVSLRLSSLVARVLAYILRRLSAIGCTIVEVARIAPNLYLTWHDRQLASTDSSYQV